MNNIQKYHSFLQRIQYTKLYRLPLWLFNRFAHSDPSADVAYKKKMRLGHSMRVRPTQKYLKNILYSGQYHDENIFMAKQFIKEGSTILDIGANIGLYACAYAELYKSDGLKIFAIEALKNNYLQLQDNISLNDFSNIKAFNLALGKEAGSLTITLPSEGFVGNAVGDNIDAQSGDGVKVEVPMLTLDSFAKENQIESCDFIKMDIEGAEYFVFEGGMEFLKKTRPVIQSEYNRHWVESIGKSFADFYKLFSPLDYQIFIEKEDSFEVIESPESFVIKEDLLDLLFVPKEKL